MPFPAQELQPFTEQNVSSLCPMQMGVYGIFNAQRACLYIGQTTDLRSTLLQHLRGQSYPSHELNDRGASFWMATLARFDQLDGLEMVYDAEYRPICNTWEPSAMSMA